MAATRSRRPRHASRIATVLAVVVVVPLVGVALLSVERLEDTRATHRQAAAVGDVAATAVGLARLDAALSDEKNWAAVESVVLSIGIEGDLIGQAVGTDPVDQLARARAHTDEVLAQLTVPGLDDALRPARSSNLDFRGVVASYDQVLGLVTKPLDDAVMSVTTAAAGTGSAQRRVAATAADLSAAIKLRRATTAMIEDYYTTIFDVRDTPAHELAHLIVARGDFDARVQRLSLERTDPAVRRAAAAVSSSVPTGRLLDAVDELIERSLRDGTPERGRVVEMRTISGNPNGFAAVFASSSTTQVDGLALVDVAGDNVLDATRRIVREADAEQVRVSWLVGMLAVLSLVAAALGSALIARPLRRLAAAARSLSDGRELPSADIGGPVEVRAAGDALREASQHLELVTEQARALAAGDLDDAVLDRSAPGGLGTAVQRGVATLREALTQQDEFRRRLAHEATHDGLTQLPNRSASLAQLTRALARTQRSGSQLAVLFLDLDHFKDVNDQHGHHAGDAVLAAVSQRLVNGVREGDHVGRLGGDEFVVIAEPVGDIDEAVALAERLVEAVNRPVDVGDVTVSVGASVGVALAAGDALTPDEVLRDADLAVYRAKERARGSVEVCDEDLRSQLAEAADLTAALRQAVERDELVLHYQPIVTPTPEGGRLRALEALVRWQRPGFDRLVMPDAFIGHAERSMLIVDLDRWVVRAVARQLAAWQAIGDHDGTPVSVNVSRRHLAHDHFVQHVLGPFDELGVDPSLVIVEVTESALLDDMEAAAVKLEQLRARGMAVAIDDFGTGFTSLAHLRSLPVDILKIDRSFTSAASGDDHEASIVKLIIDTGHLLGATITAEGVETAVEAAILAGLGSDSLQGYYYDRPRPADQVRFGLIEVAAVD